jgi:hypothetical protein
VSGWEQRPTPDPSRPTSQWSEHAVDPLGPGQLLRKGWRLYRSMPGRLLPIAVIVAAIQAVLALPAIAPTAGMVEGMFTVIADYFERVMANPQAYRYADQRAIQAELDAQLRAVLIPANDLAVLSAIGSGVSIAVGLVGTAALAAMALSIAAGRPIPIAFAFRLVAARAGLVKPIVAIGLGGVAVSLLSLGLQGSPDVQAWAGATGSPRATLIAALLSVLALVVVVGIVALAVRWALFIPAVLVEALGTGPGLSRAAELTKGIRIRLGLAMVGALLLEGLIASLVAIVVAVVLGLAAGSVLVGFAAYLVADLMIAALWAPWLPAVFAVAYRERTVPADPDPSNGPSGAAS